MQTREDWLINTTHYFPNKTQEQVLLAAEQVFKLSDSENDLQFAHTENSIYVQRTWFAYMVLAAAQGTWHFNLTTSAIENSTKASLMITGASQSMMAMVNVPVNSASIFTAPQTSNLFPFSEVYKLFWGRMDALLYGNQAWLSCDKFIHSQQYDVSSKSVEPLCFNASDNQPERSVFRKVLQDKREQQRRQSISNQSFI